MILKKGVFQTQLFSFYFLQQIKKNNKLPKASCFAAGLSVHFAAGLDIIYCIQNPKNIKNKGVRAECF